MYLIESREKELSGSASSTKRSQLLLQGGARKIVPPYCALWLVFDHEMGNVWEKRRY
jgi:hypothetical protein